MDVYPMNPFIGPQQLNLHGALEKAQQKQLIPRARVARVRAAVAQFSRRMRRSPSELPAHQGYVIRQMQRLRRQATGVSPKTLSNTRSELLYLIKTVCGR